MDRVQILSTSLLDQHRELTDDFTTLADRLAIELGWHYRLDLTWTAAQLAPAPRMQVMDAGAGVGALQWWFADQAVDVISVDRLSRRNLPIRFRQRYRIRGWRKEDLAPLLKSALRGLLPPRSPRHWHLYPQNLAASVRQWRSKPEMDPASGTIFIYNHELASMPDIPDDSVDAVVSISALEHNLPDELRGCVAELMRVLKPGGKLVATLAAAKGRDWFHQPSKGWCYTETTLRDIFDLQADCPSNYDRYDELFEALRNCFELRDNLAESYFKSGSNGMPWGVWDPKYQPVGLVKVKGFCEEKSKC